MPFVREYLTFSIVILSAFAFLLVSVAMWPGTPVVDSDPECTAIPNLRIKVGEALLSVPRRYAPSIYSPEGKIVGHAMDICQRPGDPAIEAKGITKQPGFDRRSELEPDSITGPVWHVQIEIRRYLPSFRTSQESYDHAVRFIERQGGLSAELPQKHGFFAYDSISPSPHFYITPQETSVWLDPAPLVIECSSVEISGPGERGTYYGRTCYTGYYRFSDTLAVRYRFYDGRHPIETWIELDASVHAFVQSLVKDDP